MAFSLQRCYTRIVVKMNHIQLSPIKPFCNLVMSWKLYQWHIEEADGIGNIPEIILFQEMDLAMVGRYYYIISNGFRCLQSIWCYTPPQSRIVFRVCCRDMKYCWWNDRRGNQINIFCIVHKQYCCFHNKIVSFPNEYSYTHTVNHSQKYNWSWGQTLKVYFLQWFFWHYKKAGIVNWMIVGWSNKVCEFTALMYEFYFQTNIDTYDQPQMRKGSNKWEEDWFSRSCSGDKL